MPRKKPSKKLPVVRKKKPTRKKAVQKRKPRVAPKKAKAVARKKSSAKKIAVRRIHELRVMPSRQFTKHEGNPIIEPREHRAWESKATFNPGVLFLDGNAHIVYRAIGDDDRSVLGYALSRDGVSIHERSDEPIYFPGHKTDARAAGLESGVPLLYGSGGGWNGGCEDPRLTRIGDTIYLVYTAFDGWGSLRLALSSISVEDFVNKKWNWKKPMLISPEGEIHKNWVIFPEKINGKYAVLHSIAPDVKVDYLETLDEFDGKENVIRSKYDPKSGRRKGVWDNWVRGAGPPPIKTKYGWLLFYHAMDEKDPNKYKLGAMILDANDPTRVLYRSKRPLLEPSEYYENHGFKGGVIYSCGAGVIDENLFVYYGGADTVVCVATANLEKFLQELTHDGAPTLRPVEIKKKK